MDRIRYVLAIVIIGLLSFPAKALPPVDTLELTIPASENISLSGTIRFGHGLRKNHIIILVSAPRGSWRYMRPDKIKRISAINYDYLANKLVDEGYTVFSYDSRGVGKSSGVNDSLTLYEHAQDLSAICRYLKAKFFQGKAEITLIGHSEGADTATVAASVDGDIHSLILLSAQGYSGWNFWRYQLRQHYTTYGEMTGLTRLNDSLYNLNSAMNVSLFDTLNRYTNTSDIQKAIRSYFKNPDHQMPDKSKALSAWINPQQIALRKYDPGRYLAKVKCPVLALCGTKDARVDCYPNLSAIKNAVHEGKGVYVDTFSIANVDHHYRTLAEGKVWNLQDKSEAFSGEAWIRIMDWLKNLKS